MDITCELPIQLDDTEEILVPYVAELVFLSTKRRDNNSASANVNFRCRGELRLKTARELTGQFLRGKLFSMKLLELVPGSESVCATVSAYRPRVG